MVGFTIGTEKIYAHTDTVCSSRELLSQANSYWKKPKQQEEKKRTVTKQKCPLHLEKNTTTVFAKPFSIISGAKTVKALSGKVSFS